MVNELEMILFVSHSSQRERGREKEKEFYLRERWIKTNLIPCRCLATRAKSEQSLSLVFSMQNVKKQKQWSLKEPTDSCRSVNFI